MKNFTIFSLLNKLSIFAPRAFLASERVRVHPQYPFDLTTARLWKTMKVSSFCLLFLLAFSKKKKQELFCNKKVFFEMSFSTKLNFIKTYTPILYDLV